MLTVKWHMYLLRLVIPHFIYFVDRDADSKMIKSLERLLNIWQERGIYDKELIKQARYRLSEYMQSWNCMGSEHMVSCEL